MTSGTLVAPPESPAPPSSQRPARTYSCRECGHVLRVSGLGRHRIYFEPADERSSAPVMNGVCPQCGQELPGKNGS